MAINNNTPRAPGCTPLKGCLIVTGLAMGLFIVAMAYMIRMPSMQSIRVCGTHMQEVGAAISRYSDVNGHRPGDLDELSKDFLKDPSVLRCPLDRSSGNRPSYTYNPRAMGRQVMLECDRHRIRRDMPQSRLRVLGDGTTFTMANPGVREAMKQAERQAERQSKH